MPIPPMLRVAALLLPGLAACAHAQPGVAEPQAAVIRQPPVAVTNSPPPRIVTVPYAPGVPVLRSAPPLIVQPPPGARIVRAPQERRPAQAYVSDGDYPASALANREQGKVRVALDVGPDGRVHGCLVTRSSGSRALDAATCQILRRRARFTPAADSNGQPAAGRVEQEVEWRLPG